MNDFKLDKIGVRHSYSNTAAGYNDSAFLQKEIGLRLLEHLQLMSIKPEVTLDLGAGTGLFSQQLLKKYPASRLFAIDSSGQMLQQINQPLLRRKPVRICGDAEALPVIDSSVDLIFSNLMLHECSIDMCFAEAKRVLTPGGLILFSTLGPDSLIELRQSSERVEGELNIRPFTDMHDVGDALMSSGFSEPVMEMEKITINYSSLTKLLQDLTGISAYESSASLGLQSLEKAYTERFGNSDRIPATFEVIYGHAWLGEVVEPADASYFPVSEIKKNLLS